MSVHELRGKDLRKLGFPQGKVISLALNVLEKYHKHIGKAEGLALLEAVLLQPEAYLSHPEWAAVALELCPPPAPKTAEMAASPKPYEVFGADLVDAEARRQMDLAMMLPVAVSGALMPDAHVGYGLPIGGVLATDNAVIPYGVGVDIGCRMSLSVFPIDAGRLPRYRDAWERALLANTRFGLEVFDEPKEHEVLESPLFREMRLLKRLHGKAGQQLGSSGGGNHFVELGIASLAAHNGLGLEAGRYIALLSHSGSRGLGASIADHYVRAAMEATPLPKAWKHLAWLDLDSELGQEYWLAMNLAGDYASACHHYLHARLAKALGEKPVAKVENHHNFAWLETLSDGRQAVVHRKGATPAGEGVLGIIPGSMTTPGFLVRGLGNGLSLASASHGAGRLLSRGKAREQLTKAMMRDALARQGVTLFGGGLDEAPMAYKNILEVMERQRDLVEVLGTFEPCIIRMAPE